MAATIRELVKRLNRDHVRIGWRIKEADLFPKIKACSIKCSNCGSPAHPTDNCVYPKLNRSKNSSSSFEPVLDGSCQYCLEENQREKMAAE